MRVRHADPLKTKITLARHYRGVQLGAEWRDRCQATETRARHLEAELVENKAECLALEKLITLGVSGDCKSDGNSDALFGLDFFADAFEKRDVI